MAHMPSLPVLVSNAAVIPPTGHYNVSLPSSTQPYPIGGRVLQCNVKKYREVHTLATQLL
ncbi:hypothetical protein SLEP1_g33823 [Rubroshorea leprosula]|uniref:Uncharacterized protein n=1 Tax=Rubroshorea leprosula TaxID=152421 RepID=A0AAV5KHU1_9ROSI|nr:hypothetical protein SLEP1_g33823 [Rubroshorea leprosula]